MNSLSNNSNVLNNILQTSSISPLLTDIGAALVFGLGFFFFKTHFKKENNEKISIDKSKPLKEKIEETINKWESAICLQKINSIIKNEVSEINFDPFMVIDQLNKNNINPDITTINNLLDICNKLGDNTNFNRLCELIIDSENDLNNNLPASNIVTFNIILKGINIQMCKLAFSERASFCKGKIEILFNELNRIGLKPNDITINTIIDIMVESGNFDSAWKYFDDMQKLYEIQPDIYTYSTLLKSIKNYSPDQKNIERAFDILKIIKLSKTKGVKPDEILYNCIIDTCVKYKRIEQAEAVFNDMKDAQVSPSKITYSIMIRGYGNEFNLDKANEMFDEMKEKNIQPNENVYGCLLYACVKSCKIEKACEIYDEIKNISGINMNIVLYSTLIKGYTKIKKFDKAFEIYNNMQKDKNILPNIIGYNAILDCCVECFDIQMMKSIFDEVKQNSLDDDSAPQPDVITYSTVMKGYSKIKDTVKVMDLYYYLKGRDDLEMDDIIFNTTLDGLLKSGKFDEALNVYEDMKKHNFKRGNSTFSILIKLFSKLNDVEKAVQIYNEMLNEKIKPTLITYTAILQILIKSKRIQNAIEIFEEILENKIEPDQVLFNVIINGCIYNGKLEEACKFLKESFTANIKLHDDVYKNVLNNLLNNKRMESNYKNELTLSICKEIRNRGMEIDYIIYHRILKMVYQNRGKNADNLIDKKGADSINNIHELEIEEGESSGDNENEGYKSHKKSSDKKRSYKYYNKYDDYENRKNKRSKSLERKDVSKSRK